MKTLRNRRGGDKVSFTDFTGDARIHTFQPDIQHCPNQMYKMLANN